jgi:hypothetical protein
MILLSIERPLEMDLFLNEQNFDLDKNFITTWKIINSPAKFSVFDTFIFQKAVSISCA